MRHSIKKKDLWMIFILIWSHSVINCSGSSLEFYGCFGLWMVYGSRCGPTNLLLNANSATFLGRNCDIAPQNTQQTLNHSEVILTRGRRHLSSCSICLPLNKLPQISWMKFKLFSQNVNIRMLAQCHADHNKSSGVAREGIKRSG